MTTYYSDYGYSTSSYFTSEYSTDTSYTRPALSNFVCFSVKKEGKNELHVTGVYNDESFPLFYRPVEETLTTELSDKNYSDINSTNPESQNKIATNSHVLNNKDIVFVSAIDGVLKYRWDYSRNEMYKEKMQDLISNSPIKIVGKEADGNQYYVILNSGESVVIVREEE